jgi:hypothetical protein
MKSQDILEIISSHSMEEELKLTINLKTSRSHSGGASDMSNWAGFWIGLGILGFGFFIGAAMMHPTAHYTLKSLEEAQYYHKNITHTKMKKD